MEFKSQICTNEEQSNRLLVLGLNPETADMKIIPYTTYVVPKDYDMFLGWGQDAYTPSWSLHRLMELCPESIHIDEYADTSYWFKINRHDNKIMYGNSYKRWIYLRDGDNLFDTLIDCIEWLIKEGYFNKEYLNEK